MQVSFEAAIALVGLLGGLIGALIVAAENRGAMKKEQERLHEALLGENGVCVKLENMVTDFYQMKAKLENGLLKRVETINTKMDGFSRDLNNVRLEVNTLQTQMDAGHCRRDPNSRTRKTDIGGTDD